MVQQYVVEVRDLAHLLEIRERIYAQHARKQARDE